MAGRPKRKGVKRRPAGKQKWADHYTHKAKSDQYPARSVYKLMEIQQKFQVFKKGDHVLDLGCAPGSWLLYAAKEIGTNGQALGIDLKKVEAVLPENTKAMVNDILKLDDAVLPEDTSFNVVLSDMAPATTGRKDVDALRSFELCAMAMEIARARLAPGGNFVCKIFQGREFNQFQKDVKSLFKVIKIFKPESCRKSSKEIYIIAKGKK